MRGYDLPKDFEERLLEWGRVFRDRRPLLSHFNVGCVSIESRYKRRSEDFEAEYGEGYQEAAPRPRAPVSVLRAIETWECIRKVCDVPGRWALTYRYCYPHLPRGVVLGAMRHRTTRRYSWRAFCDLLDAAEARVYTCINIHPM